MNLKTLYLNKSFNISVLIAAFFCVLLFFVYYLFYKPLVDDKHGQYFILDPGTSAPAFVAQLHDCGLTHYPQLVLLLIELRGDSQRLHAGEYFVQPTTGLWQLLDQVAAGKVALHELKIIEGWNFHQMMEAVRNNPYLSHKLTALSDEVIMQKLGYAQELPEGKFFPSTYLFSLGTEDIKVLRQAHMLMDKLLAREWGSRDSSLPYNTAYQALIVASMIEKEASRVDERNRISGIIARRLEQRMPLQIDATVIYSLGEHFSGTLTKNDLKLPSVFNTYSHKYLPPTPIAMPGLTSMHAALHPTPGNELYYVAKGNGQHYFSDNLDQHHRAIEVYREHVLDAIMPAQQPY